MPSPTIPQIPSGPDMPGWVPQGALHYLAHTEMGHPIRALARAAGCHASTIMRQIRRVETRRDDPLVDAALRRLGAVHKDSFGDPEQRPQGNAVPDQLPDDAALMREARRILRRLCESGAVLAVATDMEKAVVVRDSAVGDTTRTAVVSASVAQAMALKDWIAPGNTGRIVRYQITAAGRSALADLMRGAAPLGTLAPGFAEAQEAFEPADEMRSPAPNRRARYSVAESPLIALSRRRDAAGKPFLQPDLVAAGERLREDFELARMGGAHRGSWDIYLIEGAGDPAHQAKTADESGAQARVATALADLGPGLSDVALHCCCFLEGLETTEKRMGWSARSGKVVLRIALHRLSRHYARDAQAADALIG